MDNVLDELECLIALSRAPGIGEMRMKTLLARYGSARMVFQASGPELEKSGVLPQETASALPRLKDLEAARQEARTLRKIGARVITLADASYPVNLKPLDEAPPLLYVLGNLRPADSQAIAIVGSRRATAYGRAAAERLAYELAGHGVTVVSGLAAGIDTSAHRGALKAGGRTIAVLGCGLDVDYPASNRALRGKIASAGALVTEFPLSTKPLPGNFPKRNRIVSGLSLGIVVVEAAPKSGTSSTVKWAADQGREVFAVPGDINRKTSAGTNRLICEGAKLTTCALDILEEVGIGAQETPPAERVHLTKLESRAVEALRESPVHIDDIAKRSGMTVSEALSVLLSLELKGVVRQTPGKVFTLEPGYE
jgi:DNA processing protein